MKTIAVWLIFAFVACGILITGADLIGKFGLPSFGSDGKYQAQIEAERTRQAAIEANRAAAQARFEISLASLNMDAADRRAERFQQAFQMFSFTGFVCILLGMCVVVLAMAFCMLTHRQSESSAERRFHERIATMEAYKMLGVPAMNTLQYYENVSQIPYNRTHYERILA